jgi:hypothetical protein
MRVISLVDQLEFSRKCLESMKKKERPEDEIALQESICWTIEARIKEKSEVGFI